MAPQYSSSTRLRDYIAFLLPWAHGHQLKAIGDFVAAIIEQQTTCQAQLARYFGKQEAAVKRLSRLLHNERLDPRQLADAVLLQALHQLPQHDKVRLAIDWTIEADQHLLVVSLVVGRRAVPMYWRAYHAAVLKGRMKRYELAVIRRAVGRVAQAVGTRRVLVAALLAATARGVQRSLLVLPTGTGKTIVFALLVQRRPGRSLILAHRDELIQQAVDKLHLVDPILALGVVQASRDEHTAPIVVASVQTLSRRTRLARLVPDFQTIVIDEAHHAPAPTYRRILEYCRAWRADGPLVVGVTATPERGDHHSLRQVFDRIVYQRTLLEMMQAGYLVDLRAFQVLLQADFDALRTQQGDFVEAELETLLVAACEQDDAGLQTRACVGQRFVRIRPPVGQHSVQMGQHSGAKGLQTGVRANTPCE